MFKKSKLALLCAFALTGLSSTSAVYATAATVKGETAALGNGDVVTSANPTFVFAYDPTMSGILVSLTEGLASGDSTDDVTAVDECGTESETAFLGLSEMSCSSSGCDWIPSLTLKDGSSYQMNYEPVIAGAVTMSTNADCTVGDVANGPVFKVDLGGTVTSPVTAPPEQVKINMVEDEKCTAAIAGDNCVIKFTHNNSPAAASYRVWITDVNNIQIDEDKLTAKADQSLDINGWFDANGGSAYETTANGGMSAYVNCTPELDGSRDCKLNIHGTATGTGAALVAKHAVYDSMAAGKFKVWIRAWNAKGYALWSDSVVLDMH